MNNLLKFTKDDIKSILMIIAFAGLLVLLQNIAPGIAEASSGGGGSMVWETPLQRIQESISGPVARIACLVAIVIAGLALGFGHMGGMAQKVCMLVIGVSVALGGTSVMSSLFGSGSGLGF